MVVASWFNDAKALAEEVEEKTRTTACGSSSGQGAAAADFPSPRYWTDVLTPRASISTRSPSAAASDAAERQGARLFEHSPATAVRRVGSRWRVASPVGEVIAERLVLCQSAYPPRLLPALARAALPVFTYIIVTAPLTGPHAEVIRAPYAVYDNRFATGTTASCHGRCSGRRARRSGPGISPG